VLDEAGRRAEIARQDQRKSYGQTELSDDEREKLKRI
jgi:hypothetical protein